MKYLRLFALAAALLALSACSVSVTTPTPTVRVVPLPTGSSAAPSSSGSAPSSSAAPGATVSPSPTRVLRAALPTDTPRTTATAAPAGASGQPAPARPALTGRIVLQTSSGGDIVAVNADGTRAVTLGAGLDPAWSPDGKQIAFTRWTNKQGVYVVNADGSNERLVFEVNGAKSPTWSPDGTKIAFGAVYKRESRPPRPGSSAPATVTDYWRISVVNLASGQKTDVMLDGDQQAFTPSWGADGRFVYKGVRGLFVTSETGWPTAITSNPLQVSPAWSPDGSKIAVMVDQHDHWDIAVLNSDGGGLTFLTSTPFVMFTKAINNVAPAWSPDGRSLAFLSDREGAWAVFAMNPDGSDQRKLLSLGVTYEYAAERVLSWTK